jgi:hypothetical protein
MKLLMMMMMMIIIIIIIIIIITVWSRVEIDTDIRSACQKNSPPFMKPESSLPCSKESATGIYRRPNEPSPQPKNLFL